MQCEAEPLIGRFGKFVEENTTRHTTTLDELVSVVRKIEALPDSSIHTSNRVNDRNEAITACIRTYTGRRMSEHYPMIDDELFEKRRWVCIDFANDPPAIVSSVLTKPEDFTAKDTRRWANIRLLVECHHSVQVHIASISWPGRPRMNCAINANFPGCIGIEEQQHGLRATALLYRIHADLLDCPTIAPHIGDVEKPHLSAFWIPSLESLYTREQREPDKRDPALVLTLGQSRFLCCTWDASGEEPLESLIREFSAGGKVNVTRRRSIRRR